MDEEIKEEQVEEKKGSNTFWFVVLMVLLIGATVFVLYLSSLSEGQVEEVNGESSQVNISSNTPPASTMPSNEASSSFTINITEETK